MCTVSLVGDGWKDQFPQRWPQFNPDSFKISEVSRMEFEALKREVEELRELLKAAKAFDKATGQPDCHMDDKVALIKKVAEMVGVDLGDVFGA